MLFSSQLHRSCADCWSQFANDKLPEKLANLLFFFGRKRGPGEQLHFRNHRYAVTTSGKSCSQPAAEQIKCDVGVEQTSHSHSPRTRCCHANGSSGNRSVPANFPKSLGPFVSLLPFTRDSRN